MAYYSTYNFPNHKSGDTFLGVIFTLTDGNDDPIDLDGAVIELKTLSPHIQELTTVGGGGISIIDESSSIEGKFQIDEQVIDWCAGSYEYEIVFTLASGHKRTYIKGTWVIES
jgi:hypothetical protein